MGENFQTGQFGMCWSKPYFMYLAIKISILYETRLKKSFVLIGFSKHDKAETIFFSLLDPIRLAETVAGTAGLDGVMHRALHTWRSFHGKFWNWKLTEISKTSINIIQTSRKVTLILLKKEVVVQKSSPLRPFSFWTQNSRHSLSFAARKMFKKQKKCKN